jgi:hypothetical protein
MLRRDIMPKQTIEGQQQMIKEEQKIIENLLQYYKRRKIPEYEKMYIKDLEEKISKREAWIEQQLHSHFHTA